MQVKIGTKVLVATAIIIQLADGESIELSLGTPPKRRDRPKKQNNAVVANVEPATIPNGVPAVVEPPQSPTEKPKRKGGFRRRPQNDEELNFWSLDQIEGVGEYETKKGPIPVAILKHGNHPNGTPWYKLAFFSEDGTKVFHNGNGFWANVDKLTDIKWIDRTPAAT